MHNKTHARKEGEAALDALDRALAKKPQHDGQAFSAMTEHLCAMRDDLIRQRRSGGGSQDALERVNAVISSGLAGHFPLGNAPWPEIEQARESLKDLIAGL